MAFIVKRDAPVIPAGIPVASTNNIIMAGSGPAYTAFFGAGNADGLYPKQNNSQYGFNVSNSIIYSEGLGAWYANWDNGDNSYDWATAPQSSASVIPTNWGNGITITAA